MELLDSPTPKVFLAVFMLLLGTVWLTPTAIAGDGCQFRVEVTNPDTATSNADISRLGVRVSGGAWRNIQEGGERILAPGQTYAETFSPTIATEACDARRRYRVHVKCKGGGGLLGLSSTISKNWFYVPNETGWTTRQTIAIDTHCP
jgi:hypothetical protein